MFRPRISVRSGCLRCKKRRKKCDEQKPDCGYCARWHLSCDWPNAYKVHGQTGNAGSSEAGHENLSPRQKTVAMKMDHPYGISHHVQTLELDPFHVLPLVTPTHRPYVTKYLYHFFKTMVSGALPLDIRNTRLELAHGWARSIYSDAAVCYAFAAYIARLQSKQSGKASQERHSLEYEANAMRPLRQRLNSELQVTERTILLAALHYVIVALDSPDAGELRRISEGITAMVVGYGGRANMLRSMHLSTTQSIEISDSFSAFLHCIEPMFLLTERPTRPQSLDCLYTANARHAELGNQCNMDILTILEDLNLILFFRHPSRQVRKLLEEEAWYIYHLLRLVDNRLGHLQVQYQGTGTISEVIIFALLVVKREVVVDQEQAEMLARAILRRLRSAILAVQDQHSHAYHDILIWACLVALVGSHVPDIRDFFANSIHRMFELRFYAGSIQSLRCWDWDAALIESFRSILWHARIEQAYLRLRQDFINRQYSIHGKVTQKRMPHQLHLE